MMCCAMCCAGAPSWCTLSGVRDVLEALEESKVRDDGALWGDMEAHLGLFKSQASSIALGQGPGLGPGLGLKLGLD